MQIAILGTGRMARGIGYALRETAHDITFGSRDAARAELLAKAMHEEHGRRYHGTQAALAVARADVIFLAVPWDVAGETLRPLREALDGRVLVDLTNPLAPTFDGLVVAEGTSASEEIAKLVGPRVHVVAALKNTFASTFAEPNLAGGPAPDVLVCGDDAAAKKTAMELVAAMGFGALDAGPLRAARTIERMTVLLIGLNARYHWSGVAGFKLLHQSPPSAA